MNEIEWLIKWLTEQINYFREAQKNNYLNKSYFQALEDAYVSVLDKICRRDGIDRHAGL